MIPSSQALKTMLSTDIFMYNLFEGGNYFETAEEFIRLNKIFSPVGFLAQLYLWIDMLISPLITLVTAIMYQEPPGVFSLMSIHKTVTLWQDWITYRDLKKKIHEWTLLVKSIGGPFISTNDPEYHAYVYADAMQRIHYSFFPKK